MSRSSMDDDNDESPVDAHLSPPTDDETALSTLTLRPTPQRGGVFSSFRLQTSVVAAVARTVQTSSKKKTISEMRINDNLSSGSTPGNVWTEHRPRKGHRKSRRGCLNCKRRKVKCQETFPACQNCCQRDLECRYPPLKPAPTVPAQAPIIQPQGTPTVFSMEDMLLFHHFMLDAYPFLPVGNDSVWVCSIPLVAHHLLANTPKNAYLMHAILGLAALHLQLRTGEDKTATAITHRYLAIKGSNEALSRPLNSSDADALLGACFALTFQTSYMHDGLLEFVRMARGCALLSRQLKAEGFSTCFDINQNRHWFYMQERLLDPPVIDLQSIRDATTSLAKISTICNTSTSKHFYGVVAAVPGALAQSSNEGYFKFIDVYQAIGNMDNTTFNDFMDPSNQVSLILLTHFVAIQMLMTPILDREWFGRATKPPLRVHHGWIFKIYKEIPPELKHFIEWPKSIADDQCRKFSGVQGQAQGQGNQVANFKTQTYKKEVLSPEEAGS